MLLNAFYGPQRANKLVSHIHVEIQYNHLPCYRYMAYFCLEVCQERRGIPAEGGSFRIKVWKLHVVVDGYKETVIIELYIQYNIDYRIPAL